MKTSEAPNDVGLRNTIANDPNEGVMERNGVKRNDGRERNPDDVGVRIVIEENSE